MGEKSGEKGGGKGLGPDEVRLWQDFTAHIAPLSPSAEKPVTGQPKRWTRPGASRRNIVPVADAPSMQAPPQLDARTDARLRRGQMPIEGRLDLHGMTQEQAHTRLNDFIVRAHAAGKRCVLVITGKGLSRSHGGGEHTGVLRQKLPLWLSMPPLRGIVLKSCPAVQRDGGTGAWYLYLRRTRDY